MIEDNQLALAQVYFSERLQNSKTALFYAVNKEINTPPVESFLTASEITALVSFNSDERKNQYVVSRWLLKNLLQAALNVPANEIEFEKTQLGKIFLNRSRNGRQLYFNIAHTKNITMLGFAEGLQIGVDVEKFSDKKASSSVANRFFQPSEVNWINKDGLNENQRLIRFFRIWSLKEAAIKAIGGGIFKNIQQFFFEEENGELKIRSMVEPWSCSENWEIIEFEQIPEHACSVALYRASTETHM